MARPTFRQGRILWARLRSRSGKRELHPAAIISSDRDIVQPEHVDPRKAVNEANAVAVVGISTEFAKYPPYILLPYSPNKGGHAITKLTQACGACIGWYDWVALEDDVEGKGGDVPPAEMDRIMNATAADLAAKLKRKVAIVGRDLVELHEMLERLLGKA